LANGFKAPLDRQTNVLHFHIFTALRSMGDIEDGDVVAIAETRHSGVAFDLIRGIFPADRMLAPSFLRVLQQRADFTPPEVAH
jgi:hypothetical protein